LGSLAGDGNRDLLQAFLDTGGVDRVLRPIHGPCRRLIDYDDFRQEVLYRALRTTASFQGTSLAEYGGWLKVIGARFMTDLIRQSRHQHPGPLPPQVADTSTRSVPDAADFHLNLDWLRAVRAALPPDDRELLERRYERKQGWGEIATAMGLTPNNLAQRHVRLIARCRALRPRGLESD
jgi:RNA polymerase sigma factor (sigma-70 family)